MTPPEEAETQPIRACERCGSVSSRPVCKACEMRDLVGVK
jgi:recombinational DNA repair protein RecR